MVGACVECRGPASEWAGPLAVWLDGKGVAAERSVRTVRTVRTFARFSSWMSARGLGSADPSEDMVDEYIAAEQERSGSPTPAAFQYLPLVRPQAAKWVTRAHGCSGVVWTRKRNSQTWRESRPPGPPRVAES